MLETIKILRELTLILTKADDDGCNHSNFCFNQFVSYFVKNNVYHKYHVFLVVGCAKTRVWHGNHN